MFAGMLEMRMYLSSTQETHVDVRVWMPDLCVQVLAVRDLFVSTLFSPSHFLDHTTFDCGTLTGTTQRA